MSHFYNPYAEYCGHNHIAMIFVHKFTEKFSEKYGSKKN